MWADEYEAWAAAHPPPLERVGDMSITAWRRSEREKAKAQKQTA